MPRLPRPGSDNNIWGDILNTFLLQAHQSDGDLKNGIIRDATVANNADIDPSKIDGTAVITSDPRLSDQRTPLNSSVTNAKVAVNAAIDQSKIADLEDDLAAKQDIIAPGTYLQPAAAAEKIIYVSAQGDDANNGRDLDPALAVKTLDRAKQLMGTSARGIIQMGIGTIDAGAGFSLSGYRCSLRGSGPGTVVKPTDPQSGPVIDLTGWIHPGFEYVQEFGDFTIEGDNSTAADHTDAMTKSGMKIPGLAGVAVRNVTTRKTPGPGFDYSGSQCCNFTNLVADTPVGAETNDVPYHYAQGPCNGNRYIGLGVRSSSGGGNDTGVSGAILFEDDGTYAPDFNTFFAPWVEFIHVPTGGSIFHFKGNNNIFLGYEPFDNSKEAGATGTCHFRFDAPSVGNIGGNAVEGLIPGSQGGNDLDFGIEFNQSGNRASGAKGYNGSNVKIGSGVNRSFVLLGGANGSASTTAVTDNSGTTTNTVIDSYNGTFNITLGKFQVAGQSTLTGLTFLTGGARILGGGGFPVFDLSTGGVMSLGSGSATTDISLSRAGAGRLSIVGNLEVATAGQGLRIKEGANARMGTATLVAGTVTVANTTVLTTTRIFVQRNTDGGTVAASYSITKNAGVSFTITAKDGSGANQTADTSTLAWVMFEGL